MSGVQRDPGNVNMAEGSYMYLLADRQLLLRARLSLVLSTAPALCSGLQGPRPGETQGGSLPWW